ncbi:MAG: hypothetical protein ACO4AI_07775 [Prochlorothrix sp.]|nr:hypothetical protein [Prochlorothrix sp.]
MSIAPIELLTLLIGFLAVWMMLNSTKLWFTALAAIIAVVCGVLSYDFAPWPLQIAMICVLLFIGNSKLTTDP